MKRFLLLPLFCSFCLLLSAQEGYKINISLKPFKNEQVYLGFYYGNKKALADSVVLDNNSQGVFQGKTALPGGIYFLVSPGKQILFELLIDQDQQFSITADTTRLPESIRFSQSAENQIFQEYTGFATRSGRAIAGLRAYLAKAHTDRDSATYEAKIKELGAAMQHYRDSMISAHPASMLSAMLKALKDPVVPPANEQPGGKYDSAFAYRYYRAHYWDGISFDDGRLVRTPFFEAKLERYYRELVPPIADSIIPEVDHMLLYSRTSAEMFKFLMVHFVQKYVNPEYMGQDAVFVHLFEKYINTGQTEFFTQQYRDFLDKRAYSIMANLIGQPAANLQMVDSLGTARPLYNIKSPFTVICFWDPTCSHCKEIVPKLDSIYEAKWKKQGVTMYGVMVDGGKENWVRFIKDHHLNDWVHVYQLPGQAEADEKAGKPGYRQLYDVYQTPLLYLLDSNKRIVAKKLDYQQLNQIIDLKVKQSSNQ